MSKVTQMLLLTTTLTIVSLDSFSQHLLVENSWPPYAKKDGSGISLTIVKEAFNEVGLKPTFKVYPYARALYLTKIGKADGCFNVTKQKSTLKEYHFGETPLLTAKSSIFHLASSKYNFESVSKLPNKIRIGLIQDYEYGDVFESEKNRFIEIRVKSQKQIIQMLRNKRIDIAIMFDEVAQYTLKNTKKHNEPIVKSISVHESEIFVAFNKRNPKSKFYSVQLDKGLKSLKKKGRIDKIFNSVLTDQRSNTVNFLSLFK
jgi:polar amino acid transport system substrate-binding protein